MTTVRSKASNHTMTRGGNPIAVHGAVACHPKIRGESDAPSASRVSSVVDHEQNDAPELAERSHVAASIRSNVIARLGAGTGLRVKRVGVEIVDLHFDDDHRLSSDDDDVVELR